VVIEGGAKDWNCVKTWSIDFFRERYGHEEILLVDHTQIEAEYETPTLGDVLGGPGEDIKKYCRFYPLIQRHPEHIKDFDYDWLLKCRHRVTYDDEFEIFMGGANSYTPLHNAFSCNLFVQAYGEKVWTIYSPYYSMVFDPDPAENVYRSVSARQGSVFNPFEPDFEANPLFRYIDGLKVHLKPGDIFYNPPFWWHAVENPTDSIGVGYRWFAPFYSYRMAPLYFTLDLFARNPSIWKCLDLIKTDTNLIQLAQTGRLDQFLEEQRQKGNPHYQR